MTKEDLGKSLLISNKTAGMDPRVDYRQWLRNTLHAVLEDAIEGDESAKNFLKTAIVCNYEISYVIIFRYYIINTRILCN